jgi:hypothetical protein
LSLPRFGSTYLFEMIYKWPAREKERMGWGTRLDYAEAWSYTHT